MSHFPLLVRLTLFFSFIVLSVISTLGTVVFYHFKDNAKQQIGRNLSEIADHKAAEISNVLLFERANLLSWRVSPVMLDVAVDDLNKRIATELINLKPYYQLQGDLYVFNAAGVLIASTRQDVLKNQLPAAWQTQQDYALVFKHEVPFINGSVIAHVTALKSPQLKMQGYLVMTHSWEDISRLFKSQESRFALRRAAEPSAELFTANGVETIALGDDFAAQALWVFERNSYWGAISKPVRVGDFSFQIAAFMSEKLTQAPLLELARKLLLGAALVGVPMLVLAGLFSRHLLRPIKQLTAAIRMIEDSGGLAVKVPISGRDEMAELGDAFNRMIMRLGESFHKFLAMEAEQGNLNLSLERQVADRTSQLQDTLQKLKSAQTQLVQSEKMASLGQMTAGISDEINNMIDIIHANMALLEEYANDIKGTVEFAQSCLDEAGAQKLSTHLAQIDCVFITEGWVKLLDSQKQAADCIRNIVVALRSFSNLDQDEVKAVRLEEGLDSILQMLQHRYKGRINVERDYTLKERVECYAGELNHVFMSILVNAIQAIPDKGSIFVTTAKVNDQAVVTLADTGLGMTDKVRSKIFDPFFTTKDAGEGTGLGLSISYGIIEKHQGTLTVESELNRGTRFIIALPLRMKDA